jgi:hypothetical protein
VQISNRQASLVVNAPDLTQPLTGTVQVTVTGADMQAFPAVWTLNIDGEEQATVWTDNMWTSPLTVTFTLDTTAFANGPHEMQISMNSRTEPEQPQWVNWRGMVNRVVQFNNGHLAMDIAAQFQSMVLAPGQTQESGCVQLYTDGGTGACGMVSYQSSDARVAAVDANGIVTAGQEGFALITLRAGPRTSVARVWVTADPRIPHFLGDGTMTRGYQPGKSLFAIAPFFLDPNSIQNAGLLDAVNQSGVNTLGFGVYVNPRDTAADYATWQTGFEQNVAPEMTWARENKFHLLLTGDDIFRNIGTDAWYTLNWQYGKRAVQYAVNRLAGTGVGIGIEAIDEASSIWGNYPVPEGRIGQASYVFDRVDCLAGLCQADWPSNPVPNQWSFALAGSSAAGLNTAPGSLFTASDASAQGFSFTAGSSVNGSFTAATDPGLEYLWFAGKYCAGGTACNPVVPNRALAEIRGWMTSSPSYTPMAFPPLAVSPPAVHGAWMGPGSVSDYASHYFSSLKTRTTYPWSEGIQEMVSSIEQSWYGREPLLMLDRPQLMLVSLAGASYWKQNLTGSTYQPGVDTLDQPGVSAAHVSAVMMSAAALGGAGLRFYYFEPPSDLAARAAAPLGSYWQTGSNPENLQPESWRAMGYTANLLTKVLEPYLLNAAENSPGYGRNIVTAVRQGTDGTTMLMIVNGNDWTRAAPVDLCAFPHTGGVARYRVSQTGISTDWLPSSQMTDRVTLLPGESAVYLFPAATAPTATMPLQTVTIQPQSSDGAVQGIQYGYVYPDDVAARPVVSCHDVCTIARDPRLGPVFYRFVPAAGNTTTAVRSIP